MNNQPEFKLIVAGGREFNNYGLLAAQITDMAVHGSLRAKAVSIVSGMARGADALGAQFAKENNVKLYAMPADWDKYGKRAGFMRNSDMGNFADGLLAFWDGKSKGTAHMIDYMKQLNKPVHVVKY